MKKIDFSQWSIPKLKAYLSERRSVDRTPCGKGGCTLPPDHVGGHKGNCGCINGCAAYDCANSTL